MKTSTEDFSDFQYESFPRTSALYHPAPFLSGAQRKLAPKTSVTFNMCLSHVHLCITQLPFYRARSENEPRRLQWISICVFHTYICIVSPSSLSIGRAVKTSTADFSDFQDVSFPRTFVLHRPAPFLLCAQRKRAPKTSVTFNMCLSHKHFYCITQLPFYRARSENEHRRLQ